MKEHDILNQLSLQLADAADLTQRQINLFRLAAYACARRDIQAALNYITEIEQESGFALLSPGERKAIQAATSAINLNNPGGDKPSRRH